MAYLGEFYSNKNRAKFLTLQLSLTATGIIVQNLLALVTLTLDFRYLLFSNFEFTPWRLYILCCSLISGLTLVGLLYFPESPKFTLAKNKKAETIQILQQIYAMNTGNLGEVSGYITYLYYTYA